MKPSQRLPLHLSPAVVSVLFCAAAAAAAPFAPPGACVIAVTGPPSLPAGIAGVAYTPVAFAASGCAGGPYTWTATGLPAGMSMSAGGLLSGTPGSSSAGAYLVQATVADSGTGSGGATLPLAINAANFTVTPLNPVFSYAQGEAVPPAQTLNLGPDPVSFTIALGNTCAWLRLSSIGGTGPAQVSLSVNPMGLNPGMWTCALTVNASSMYNVTVALNISPALALNHFGSALQAYEKDPLSLPVTGVLTAGGGLAPYTWSASGLPPGVTLSTGGTVSGTPAAGSAGNYSPSVAVQDSTGATATNSFPLTVLPGIRITAATLGDGVEQASYGPISFQATGGSPPNSWSATGLPSGLGVSSSGVLSGTPAAGSRGAYRVQVTTLDSQNGADSTTLALTIQMAPLRTVGPSSLAWGRELTAYGPVTFTASGGTGGYVWSVSGALPLGVTFSSGGLLSGTPALGSHGNYTLRITVRDSAASNASMTVSWVVCPQSLSIGMASIPPGTLGVLYGQPLTATGGYPPYTWTASSSLPPGIALSPAGVLSGVPTGAAASYTVAVSVQDVNNGSFAANMPFDIDAPLALTGPASLAAGATMNPYTPVTFTATGGSGIYSWSASGLPAGLSLCAAGVLSGTPGPASAGAYTVRATVSDSNGATVSTSLTLAIRSAPMLNNPYGPPDAWENQAYAGYQLTASGGTRPYTYSAAGGLPNGMALSSAGALSGTPAIGSAGNYVIQVRIVDSVGVATVAAMANLRVLAAAPPFSITSPSALPAALELANYGPVTFAASGGAGGNTWSAIGLPPGLGMSTGGALGGTPAPGSHGAYSVQVWVRDSSSNTASVRFPLVVSVNPLSVGPAALPAGTVGVMYGPVILAASGGVAPYTWSATGGLPNGLTLSAAGVLSGTPATGSGGPHTVTAVVHDANNTSGSGTWTLTVQIGMAVASPSSLSSATVGVAYGPVAFSAVGGFGSYTWTATGLPSGLSMASGGTLGGTPADGSRGSYTVQITARDTSNAAASAILPLTVQAPQRLTIASPANLPVCEEQAICPSQRFTASGGTPPYTWSATGLPAGLNLSADGGLSGTPVAASHGAYSVIVTAKDYIGLTGAAGALALTINAPPQIAGPASLPAATAGAPYGPVTFTAASGTQPYVWSVTGPLPSGLTLSGAGVLSGQPAAGSIGSYPLTIQATDSFGVAGKAQLTLTVQAAPQPLAITGPASLPAASEQVSYGPVTFTAAGGSGGYSWSATGVPAGVTLSAGGALSGTPAAGTSGVCYVQVTVRDSSNSSAAAVLVLLVNPAPPVPVTTAAGVVNAASSLPSLAPGALISIYGSNLAPANQQAQGTPLPAALGGTSVSINGTPIPLLFVSPGQINGQVPYETPAGSATLVVQSNGMRSAPVNIQVAPTGPGVFTPLATNHVLAVNCADGSLNQATSPAAPGQYVTVYLTGQGLVSHPVPTGAAAPAGPFSLPLGAVLVNIAGQPAAVQFAGLAPYFVGLLQLNVSIPDVPAGEQPFEVTIGGVAANATVISVGAKSF